MQVYAILVSIDSLFGILALVFIPFNLPVCWEQSMQPTKVDFQDPSLWRGSYRTNSRTSHTVTNPSTSSARRRSDDGLTCERSDADDG